MSRPRRKKSNRILILIFVVGLGISLYPFFSDMYYRYLAAQEVVAFQTAVREMSDEDVEERLKLAYAYNDSLVAGDLTDPYSEEERQAGRAEYARMLEVHEKIGHVQIPKIGIDIPVYAGTAEAVLQKGAGHLEGTSLPVGGNSTHAVITAHSGLPKAKLFTDLHDMEVGDKFYFHNIGGVLAYQVDRVLVIEPDDFGELLVAPGHDYATLLTCTPTGVNSHRLLVRGHRIEYVPAVEEPLIAQNQASFLYRYLFYAMAVVTGVLLLVLIWQRKRRKDAEKELRKIRQEKRKAEEADSHPSQEPDAGNTP